MRAWRFEDGGFLVLVVAITLAAAWLVVPFFGSVMWGIIIAILFRPVFQFLVQKLGGRRNLAASLCLLLILGLVVLPALLLGVSLVQEAADLYSRLQSGDINFSEMLKNFRTSLPGWADEMLVSAGWTDLGELRRMFSGSLAAVLENIAGRALWFGQGALQLLAALGIMLYLAFFLLRDGREIGGKVKAALPLREEIRDPLIAHFMVVIRAIMKGTVVVSVLQGLVGGIIFWILGIEAPILWGLLMALFSLFPAVGTGVVWVPVAIYLLATGSIVEGGILVFCGLFVIGMIDNLLRPILVGHDAKLPEFVVLIATLAGLNLMGLNGLIMGPVIAALFIAVWQIATKHKPWGSEAEPG